MAKLRPDQLPDATAGTKFAHVVNKQNTTDGPDGTSQRLELSNLVGAINPDHVFASTSARDTYFANNPGELQTSIYCVVNSPFAYYRYSGASWVEQTGVVTGPQGEKGDTGDFSGITNNTIPKADGANLVDSPLTVDAQGNVSMAGTFTATELKTNIASLNLGDEKKISGLGEGVEIHDISQDRHKFIVTQWLDKDEDTRAFQYKQEEYQLINIQPVFDTTLTDPEFEFQTQLGDQILYGFEVKVNSTQNNCVAQIFRQGQLNPIWEETFDNVQSDTLVLGSPVVLDGNTTYVFKITGEFLGEPGGRMYYSIGARLAEKQELLDGSDRVNVDSIQTPNIQTGEGLKSEQSGSGVVIELSGNKDVIEFDVSLDATRAINNSYVGKFVSITQSGNPVAIPMQITIDQHNAFETGDTIKIGASDEYVNYYFAVYYTTASNVQRVVYPAKSVTMIRTDSGWDVEKDGTYTNVAIIPQVGTVDASQDNPLLTPVSSFAFLEHPGVSHIDNADGTRAVSIDLNALGDGTATLVDGNETDEILTGAGVTATYDAANRQTTLIVDPTNVDLTDYALLNDDVSFTKVTISDEADPLFFSEFDVTDSGNTEFNLVGTTTFRKKDNTTGNATDVLTIDNTTGVFNLLSDVTYQGSINDDKAVITKEYLEQFGRGIGVPDYITVEGGNNYQQTTPVSAYINSGTNINPVIIEIDGELLESKTIFSMPTDGFVTTKNFQVFQGNYALRTSKNIQAGDTWQVRMINNNWFWEKVYTEGGNVAYGLSSRNDIIDEPSVKAFAYAEGMPYHLLLETPTGSRLFHEFPKNKTFRFSPTNAARGYEDSVTITESNQGVAVGDLSLGQYSDLPLYIIEPNVVINRDQRAWINFPASLTIDISNGFYVFGTVSGWCGNNNTEGGVAVYLGTSENFRSYTQNIGFVLGNTGLFILDGQNVRTADNNTFMAFNLEPGVTHMYRYAFYVDAAGLMTYYIVDLNTGQVSTGTQQCNLASIGSDPKLYVSYDRYANNTAAIAIGETHLVLNSVGSAEDRWNWRN